MWLKRVLSEKEFEKLYQAFWKRLYGMSYSYVRDKTIAQELVQDVFVKLWVKRNEIAEIRDVEAYLFRCLKNKIYDHFDSVTSSRKLAKHALEEFCDEQHPVDDAIAFNEAMSLITEELEKMPEKTRTIFRMSKFGRYSNDEIATKMHLSGKAVEYHITQAVKKLRVRLAVFLS